jgi:hypothetical protein
MTTEEIEIRSILQARDDESTVDAAKRAAVRLRVYEDAANIALCVYCNTTRPKAEISAHIRECVQHPLADLVNENAVLNDAFASISVALNNAVEVLNRREQRRAETKPEVKEEVPQVACKHFDGCGNAVTGRFYCTFHRDLEID